MVNIAIDHHYSTEAKIMSFWLPFGLLFGVAQKLRCSIELDFLHGNPEYSVQHTYMPELYVEDYPTYNARGHAV